MSRTVWKVVLDAGRPSPQTHRLPFGARPIHVGVDPAQPNHIAKVAVWFEVNPDNDQCGVVLWIVGTGQEIPGTHQHIGSCVRGPYAWHVFVKSAK